MEILQSCAKPPIHLLNVAFSMIMKDLTGTTIWCLTGVVSLRSSHCNSFKVWHLEIHLQRFHLQVSDLQISCRDLTAWLGSRIVPPGMAAGRTIYAIRNELYKQETGITEHINRYNNAMNAQTHQRVNKYLGSTQINYHKTSSYLAIFQHSKLS